MLVRASDGAARQRPRAVGEPGHAALAVLAPCDPRHAAQGGQRGVSGSDVRRRGEPAADRVPAAAIRARACDEDTGAVRSADTDGDDRRPADRGDVGRLEELGRQVARDGQRRPAARTARRRSAARLGSARRRPADSTLDRLGVRDPHDAVDDGDVGHDRVLEPGVAAWHRRRVDGAAADAPSLWSSPRRTTQTLAGAARSGARIEPVPELGTISQNATYGRPPEATITGFSA